MRLLAAATTAASAALLVGWLAGAWPPPLRLKVVRAPRGEWLEQSGAGITLFQFWLLVLAVGVIAFLVVWAVSGLLVVAMPSALTVMLVPRAWLLRRRAQRMLELQRSWPDGLRDLIASISSGLSLSRSLEVMALSGPPALRTAFQRYPQLARAAGVVPALEGSKANLPIPPRIE